MTINVGLETTVRILEAYFIADRNIVSKLIQAATLVIGEVFCKFPKTVPNLL
jgi:hypothetical protein